MHRAKTVVIVLVLAFLYPVGLAYLIGLFASIDFLGQFYAGKSAMTVYSLTSIPHAVAVVVMASVVALAIAKLFRDHPVRFGLMVAAPTAMHLGLSIWPASDLATFTSLQQAFMVKDFLLVSSAPALLALLFISISNRATRQGPPSHAAA